MARFTGRQLSATPSFNPEEWEAMDDDTLRPSRSGSVCMTYNRLRRQFVVRPLRYGEQVTRETPFEVSSGDSCGSGVFLGIRHYSHKLNSLNDYVRVRYIHEIGSCLPQKTFSLKLLP